MALLILDGPYAKLYDKAYLRLGPDNRRRVDLFNSNEDRTTISYARYLLSRKHNRLLEIWEEADHIDEDCSNDHIDNLQILTVEEHKLKTAGNKSRTMGAYICPVCDSTFTREVRQVKVSQPKCSRRCNGLATTLGY